jgi:hypothetical protein
VLVLLVLLSSGDDINCGRLAVPSFWTAIPVGSLPTDDENTDFLRLCDEPAERFLTAPDLQAGENPAPPAASCQPVRIPGPDILCGLRSDPTAAAKPGSCGRMLLRC